jgi:hypothetical protein
MAQIYEPAKLAIEDQRRRLVELLDDLSDRRPGQSFRTWSDAFRQPGSGVPR